MAKNPRLHPKDPPASNGAVVKKSSSLSKRGKKVIAAGVGIVILGYWLLTFTDPAGQNWAGTVSPAVLVLGYALIGIGIVLPDPTTEP